MHVDCETLGSCRDVSRTPKLCHAFRCSKTKASAAFGEKLHSRQQGPLQGCAFNAAAWLEMLKGKPSSQQARKKAKRP